MKRIIPLAARVADGWDSPLGPSAEEFTRKVGVLERECIGQPPGSVVMDCRSETPLDVTDGASADAGLLCQLLLCQPGS